MKKKQPRVNKLACRALKEMPPISVDKSRYEQFFRHPAWLALRSEAAKRFDDAADTHYKADKMEDIHTTRGIMAALQFILDAEDNLAIIISANEKDIEASFATEQRIAELLCIVTEPTV